MVQIPKITGLFALLALLPAQGFAAPGLSGFYRGEIGQLDLQTRADGRVVGRFTGGGKCHFDPQRPVLDGELEGKVLVATITLCQTGPACDEHPYNILAFLDPSSGALVADVKLAGDCDSPALQRSRFVLEPVQPEDVQPSAPQVAVKKGRQQEAIQSAIDNGNRLMKLGDYAGAAFYFEQSLAYDERIWSAHLAVGIAELRRGNTTKASNSLSRALELIHGAKSNVREQFEKDIYYNLACVDARRNDRSSALKNLRHALELGFADADSLTTDKDLVPLHEDQEFKAIQRQVRDQREHRDQKPREATKKGEP